MVAAGFSGGEADQLRRAMASWKKNGRLNLFKDKLISGMLGKGYKQDYAEQLFEQIKGFSGYGFPESHSASFAVLAYVSCWLKYYFPAEFYIGLLNSWPMGFYTPSQLIQDAQRHQITIKPVCINNSQWDHTLSIQDHYKEIQLGLRQVKGLQEENLARVMAARPPSGFSHIRQIQQLDILNKHALEALASANALRCVAGNRFEARWQIMDKQSELPLFEEAESEALDLSPSDTQNLLEDYHSTSLSVGAPPDKTDCTKPVFEKYHLCQPTGTFCATIGGAPFRLRDLSSGTGDSNRRDVFNPGRPYRKYKRGHLAVNGSSSATTLSKGHHIAGRWYFRTFPRRRHTCYCRKAH